MSTHKFNFNFSPNLINLLGEQLIHDKKIALSELIKNAYDADASNVEVEVSDNQISIVDDGCGMSLDIIKNYWLKPGLSSKNKEGLKKTPKYKRYPIGEKGVGRLSCHKLGDTIQVITKTSHTKEVNFQIDWKIFNQTDEVNQLDPVLIQEESIPTTFLDNKTGTKIIIGDLKDKWTEDDIEDLSKELIKLLDIFNQKDNFEIILKKEGFLISDNLRDDINKIKKEALFHFKVEVNDGDIASFKYTFSPWIGLEKVSKRKIDRENQQFKKILPKKEDEVLLKELKNHKKLKIGTILFEGFIYDYDNTLWNLQKQIPKKERKKTIDYMKSNGGIRVYRDGFRVFNYGEKGHDILDLDLKRVNRPAGKISSNQIFASVQLNRNQSLGLIEKTNREGFIHNEAFFSLQKILEETLHIVEHFRQEDKAKIIRTYLDKAEDRVSIEKKIDEIITTVDSSEIGDDKKEKIKHKLSSFAKEFDQIKSIFTSAANTGLSLAIIVHELEKSTQTLYENIKKQYWQKVEEIASDLITVIKNYKDIIKVDKRQSTVSIKSLIDKAVFNCQARFKYHKVLIETDIADINVSVKQNLIIGLMNNLFDNSLYWFDYQTIKERKIFIKAYKKKNNVHMLIADNGLGFTIDFESATMPFVTGRQDKSSMGIGLHLAKLILEAHDGFLEQGDFEEEKLPEDFKNGAIVKLIFTK